MKFWKVEVSFPNLFNFENSKKLESDSKMFRYRKYEIL